MPSFVLSAGALASTAGLASPAALAASPGAIPAVGALPPPPGAPASATLTVIVRENNKRDRTEVRFLTKEIEVRK